MSAIPRPFTLMGTGSGGTPTFNGLTSTGTVVLTSAATSGLQLYNTADQTTNYERGNIFWTGNELNIGYGYGGTGNSGRIIRFGVPISAGGTIVGGRKITVQNGMPWFNWSGGSFSGTGTVASGDYTSTATSGTVVGLSLTPTYNQASGTAANTDLLINRTQTAVGSGAQLLADFQVGGTSRFSVSNTGVVVANGSAANHSVSLQFSGTQYGLLVRDGGTGDFIINSTATNVLRLQTGSTNALTLGTSQQATFAGALITTPQALSGAGAVDVVTTTTDYTSTGGAQALTLANGTSGQIKIIKHVVDGGSGVLTPTTASGFTTITFTNAGESAVLQYGSAGWVILSLRGAVAA